MVQIRDAERLDRQLRIPGWDQAALARATLGVVGDEGYLTSLFILSAAALGLNRLVVLAPRLDPTLAALARKLNPQQDLAFVQGFYAHPCLNELFQGVNALVDLSASGLANKLALNLGRHKRRPVVRGFCFQDNEGEGCSVFTYLRGREWQDLNRLVAPRNLLGEKGEDGVLAVIAAGLALEETKDLLMGRPVSEEILTYRRPQPAARPRDPAVLVVGAGALGNFAGLGLALAGFKRLAFMDPDVVEVTNLNRQVFFAGQVGQSKAETLAGRLHHLYGVQARGLVDTFRRDTGLSPYEAVFDCVDNFETRIALSEACRKQGKVLVSGGAGVEAGQVVLYDPAVDGPTPAELLGLYEIVERRAGTDYVRAREACIYQPDPAVIMTNMVIAGLMTDAFRLLLGGAPAGNIFYESGRGIA